jgi:hypothetical protein
MLAQKKEQESTTLFHREQTGFESMAQQTSEL